jgi:hypothetical protein
MPKNKVMCQALLLCFLTLMLSFVMLTVVNYILTGALIEY